MSDWDFESDQEYEKAYRAENGSTFYEAIYLAVNNPNKGAVAPLLGFLTDPKAYASMTANERAMLNDFASSLERRGPPRRLLDRRTRKLHEAAHLVRDAKKRYGAEVPSETANKMVEKAFEIVGLIKTKVTDSSEVLELVDKAGDGRIDDRCVPSPDAFRRMHEST